MNRPAMLIAALALTAACTNAGAQEPPAATTTAPPAFVCPNPTASVEFTQSGVLIEWTWEMADLAGVVKISDGVREFRHDNAAAGSTAINVDASDLPRTFTVQVECQSGLRMSSVLEFPLGLNERLAWQVTRSLSALPEHGHETLDALLDHSHDMPGYCAVTQGAHQPGGSMAVAGRPSRRHRRPRPHPHRLPERLPGALHRLGSPRLLLRGRRRLRAGHDALHPAHRSGQRVDRRSRRSRGLLRRTPDRGQPRPG